MLNLPNTSTDSQDDSEPREVPGFEDLPSITQDGLSLAPAGALTIRKPSPSKAQTARLRVAGRRGRPERAPDWRDDQAARFARQKLHAALSAPRIAEAAYVRDVVGILGGLHKGTMKSFRERLLPQRPGPVERTDTHEHTVSRATKGERPDPGGSRGAQAFAKRSERYDSDWVDAVKRWADRVKGGFAKYLKPRVGVAFDRMATRVDENGKKAATLIGIQPKAAGLSDIVRDKRAENIALISDAAEDYMGQVVDILSDPDNFELPIDDLADLLEERGGVSRSRAETIAADQTLKLNAGLMRQRHIDAGIEEAIWSSSKDERVRPGHRLLDGQKYSIADGISDDQAEQADEDPGIGAGDPVRCRCVAVPLLESEEPEGEDEEPDEDDAAAE